MSKSKDDAPHELESQFVLRLPPVSARCPPRPNGPTAAERSAGLRGDERGENGEYGAGKGPREAAACACRLRAGLRPKEGWQREGRVVTLCSALVKRCMECCDRTRGSQSRKGPEMGARCSQVGAALL